ncbi:MAG TPA: hypothetical protein VH681_00940 [Nitrospiraceae bacterium]|jgi:hypothetical protein
MNFMGMIPQISIPAIDPTEFNIPILAERFVDQLKSRLSDMQRELDEQEQLEVMAYLPSGKAILIESVGYENPALVTLHGVEQGTGKACTVLSHQSSLQILVAVDKIPVGQSPRVVTFRTQ